MRERTARASSLAAQRPGPGPGSSAQPRLVHELVEDRARLTPESLAVTLERDELTYAGLDRRANHLAQRLAAAGIGPRSLVAVSAERSIELVVALLATLKAGAAYVPIDPEYPVDRQSFMLSDSAAPVVLTQRRLADRLEPGEARVIHLDAYGSAGAPEAPGGPSPALAPEDLAYVIYTSGSTGRPKGVMVPHGALLNYLRWAQSVFPLDETDRALQRTPISFDISVWEFWGPLLAGARLVLARPGGHRDPTYLVRALTEHGITMLQVVPSLLRMLLEERGFDGCRTLRRVFCGGEALPSDLPPRFHRQLDVDLVNLYGPTEATIWATSWTCERGSDPGAPVPIGRPITNMQCWVLDHDFEPVAPGVPGELYLGGDGLARGYLNRPDLTAERFVPHPLGTGPHTRLYRTGDLVRQRPDGSLEFLGRSDDQVKIRGFRIEPGEVEAVLREHPAIREGLVVARQDVPGEVRLVAYVVGQPACPPDIAELRAFLEGKLPSYMVPAAFVLLERLPLTPNGKVDRNALPAPPPPDAADGHAFVEPETPTERRLAAVWAEVLALPRVGARDNFLDLGGHSLAASQVVARVRETMGVELSFRDTFEAPLLAELAARIDRARPMEAATPPPAIAKASRAEPLPLSFSQERVWFVQQVAPESVAYSFRSALRLHGALNVPALERSLAEIIRRHEIFRTTFPSLDGRPVQVVHPPWAVTLPLEDLASLPAAARDARCEEIIQARIRVPFDLEALPLIRWTLIRLSEREHVLVHVEHHLVHDGWSYNVFLAELVQGYGAFCRGRAPDLAELPIQFADFAAWQRGWMQSDDARRQIDYWRHKLAGAPGMIQLPHDRPRPPVPSFRGAAPKQELDAPLAEALRSLARREGATLFMVMLAGFAALLRRYSAQDDILIGSGVANRRWRETEPLIGMFVNNVVLRVDLAGNPSVRELLARVRDLTLEASVNQDAPFDSVVDAVRPERALSHNPLFQVMFSFHDAPMPAAPAPGLAIDDVFIIANGSAKFDLNLIVAPQSRQRVGPVPDGEDGLTVIWEYTTDLFAGATIDRMMRHYRAILEGMVADAGRRLRDIPLVTDAERQRLLGEWNDTRVQYPRDKTIAALFEDEAARHGERVALIGEREQVSYAELNARANRVAHWLRARGVAPDTLVGLCVERSVDMVVGMLGILKAGAAYLPLDPEYPRERLAFMVADGGARIAVTQGHLRARLAELAECLCLDDPEAALVRQPEGNPPPLASAEHLAYVMYTSGSTGRPKGAAITHRNVVRLVRGANYVRLGPDQVHLQLAPISFDASTFELWGALLNGARLALMPPGPFSPEAVGRVVRDRGVTTLWLTAELFHQMVDERLADLAGVTQLLAGGDVLSPAHVRRARLALPGTRLVNGYGPTENTTFTCCFDVERPADAEGPIPIGRPISNTQVYVLDEGGALLPVGVPGELYAGGDGVARGYHDRPELTAERFVSNPFGAGRLYRTGDRVRFREDGVLEFLGRIDGQVKLRGYRIEPAEIEIALADHADVGACAVLVREDWPGDRRLVAYVVPAPGASPSATDLRAFLKTRLPSYMVPASFVPMTALPITPNGKLDRRALPNPAAAGTESAAAHVGPRTELEATLSGLWAGVLGVDRVSVHDSFFERGGHSLMAARLAARIGDTLGLDIGLRAIFDAPSVAEMATVALRLLAGRSGAGDVLLEIEEMGDEDAERLLAQELRRSGEAS